MKLWTKISLLATLNIALLAAVMFVYVRIELSNEFDSFLLTSAREKIQGISSRMVLDLQESDPAQWDTILKEYSDDYNVRFLLFGPNLTQLAGPKMTLPSEVEGRLRPGGGGGGGGGGRGGTPPAGQQGPRPPRGGGGGGGGRRGQQAPFLITSESEVPYWVGLGLTVNTPSKPQPIQALLLLASDSLLMNQFFFNWQSWLGILAGVLIVSAICWLPLIRGLTHSIAQMTTATAQIAEGHFDVGLKVKRRDELGRLAASINRMASRLETFTRGQKRFLGDVAHELRSPLGRMQMALGILERGARAEDAERIADIREDVEVMGGLTDGLLQVAKAGARPEALEHGVIRVAEVAQTAIRREIPESVRVETDIDADAAVQANADYVLAAISNVLRNAVKYAGAAGPIRVSTRRAKDRVLIAVADSGPGVPAEALDKIFTPFYRLDTSRTSSTGGTGLGLAIVRNSIEACGGTVEAHNRPEGGLEVVIALPAA